MFGITMIIFCLGVYAAGFPQTPVTFRVDMTDPFEKKLLDTVAGDRVLLRGSFCEWSGNDYVLEDEDRDLIYSGDFIIEGDTGKVIEYKYAVLTADGNVFYETIIAIRFKHLKKSAFLIIIKMF